MKNWTIRLLLIFYITTTTQLVELYKIPVFVSHFIDHYSGGEFYDEMKDFIVHHYGGHQKDSDWETDQQLPFINLELTHFDFCFSPIKIYKLEKWKNNFPPTIILPHNDEEIYSHYLDSIWQPPKQS